MFKTQDYTHTTQVERHGDVWVKRDDHFTINGVSGGKVRGCWRLAQNAKGLITASSRKSPQAVIVARIAQHLGIPARLHTPKGKDTEEMILVREAGGEIIQHKAGYNNVIIRRALDDANTLKTFTYIPFGMEHRNALQGTANEVYSLKPLEHKINRIVVPIGSGMSFCGILKGMQMYQLDHIPIVGVRVGADPTKRLDNFAPMMWRINHDFKLEKSKYDYHDEVEACIGDLPLDPVYEAKCLEYLEPDDLLWVVGVRPSTVDKYNKR